MVLPDDVGVTSLTLQVGEKSLPAGTLESLPPSVSELDIDLHSVWPFLMAHLHRGYLVHVDKR